MKRPRPPNPYKTSVNEGTAAEGRHASRQEKTRKTQTHRGCISGTQIRRRRRIRLRRRRRKKKKKKKTQKKKQKRLREEAEEEEEEEEEAAKEEEEYEE